jgi:hypothetical protein
MGLDDEVCSRLGHHAGLPIMADVCLPFQRDEGDGLEKNNTVYSLSA